jgi:hypothetical protein
LTIAILLGRTLANDQLDLRQAVVWKCRLVDWHAEGVQGQAEPPAGCC